MESKKVSGSKTQENTNKQTDQDREVQININNAIQQAVSFAVADAMKPVLEEMSIHRERIAEKEAENRALRSHLESVKNPAASGIDFSLNSIDDHALHPDHIPLTSTGVATTASTDGCTRDSGSGAHKSHADPTRPTFPIARNPFTLPGLLKKDLQAIEQGEYVDFNKIKPVKIDQRRREDDEEGFGIAMSSYYDQESGQETLRFKKVSSNRVETFPEWLECWNKFALARLHYKPNEQAMLMAYLRLITCFVKRYKFPAVYNYDIDFRKTVAAERSLPPEHKTALWHTQHDELKNEHLTIDELKPPKTCFKCGQKGHVATNCNKISGNGKNRSGSGNNPRYHAPPPAPGPPPQPPQPFPASQFHAPYYSQYHQPGSLGPPTGNAYVPSFPAPTNGTRGQQGSAVKLCNTFNHKGFCWRGHTCHFVHQCNKCDKTDHGGINCDKGQRSANHTNTAFAPTSTYIPRY